MWSRPPPAAIPAKALQLFAHAAAAGQRSAGVRPHGGDDPGVVLPRQHDDVRGAEESSVSGLGVDGVGGDGAGAAEAHFVRGDDCVEVEKAVQSGKDADVLERCQSAGSLLAKSVVGAGIEGSSRG